MSRIDNIERKSVLAAAQQHIKLGHKVIPLKPKSKEPAGKWNDQKIDLQNSVSYFPLDANLGVVLGEVSGGLIDIDFDMPEAAALGEILFPGFPVFGRATSPGAHRLVICSNPGKTKQFSLTKEEGKLLKLGEDEKHVVLEVRGNGGYTMFPPSTHPNGEELDWSDKGPDSIPQMAYEDVEKKGGICAALALIMKLYPTSPGNRNNICMALDGALVRADVPQHVRSNVIYFIARHKGDEEADSRRNVCVSEQKIGAGEPVTGLPRLCELLGIPGLERKLHKWLHGEQISDGLEQKIEALNKRFFVVASEGGKCRVAFFEEQQFERDQVRNVLMLQSFPDFRNRYMHILVPVQDADGKTVMKKLGDCWLQYPARRQYERIVFDPSGRCSPGSFNLWQGFAYPANRGGWRAMQRHIYRILAKRNRSAFRYMVSWAAWAVQNPDKQAEVALVFRGGKGTGKGTFCRWLKNMFGQHGLQIYSAQHLTGRFNSHLRDCVLLFADEAIATKDSDAESVLKGYLTEPTLPVEGKGRDIVQCPNHLPILMASNADWVVPASSDERRFAVFDVSDEVVKNRDWFTKINKEMVSGGASAMLYYLQNLNLGDWHPRNNIPQNEALMDQRIKSLRGEDKVWFEWLHEGEVHAEQFGSAVRVQTARFAKLTGISTTAAGNYLRASGCLQDSGRPRGWILPPLPEARKVWNARKFKVDWDHQKDWYCVPDLYGNPNIPF